MSKRWLGVLGVMLCALLACSDDGNDRRNDDDDDGGSGGSAGNSSVTGSGAGGTSTQTGAGAGNTTASTTSGGMCDGGPLPAPIAGCTPTPLPSTGDFGQDCVDRINQFRWECQCLPPLARWTEAEQCSDQQSAADQQTNSPHGNFGDCNENAQNTCPNWGSEQDVINGCLQLMWDEGPGEPFSEHGHYINMSSTSYSKVACGRSSSGGGVWSNQNFAP